MPKVLGNPENFIQVNPLVTPVHIQPECYFLFVYPVLNKLERVVGLCYGT